MLYFTTIPLYTEHAINDGNGGHNSSDNDGDRVSGRLESALKNSGRKTLTWR